MYVYICMHTYIHKCTHLYIYTYTHSHTHPHTHTHTYMHTPGPPEEFTCFTIFTTCFTRSKVQILTPAELPVSQQRTCAAGAAAAAAEDWGRPPPARKLSGMRTHI
jgi:hypothetical protein